MGGTRGEIYWQRVFCHIAHSVTVLVVVSPSRFYSTHKLWHPKFKGTTIYSVKWSIVRFRQSFQRCFKAFLCMIRAHKITHKITSFWVNIRFGELVNKFRTWLFLIWVSHQIFTLIGKSGMAAQLEEEAEEREVLGLTRGGFRSVSSLAIVLPHTHC